VSQLPRILIILSIFVFSGECYAGWVCGSHDDCNPGKKSDSVAKTGDPSKGNAIRVNPAAVPLEVNYGIEALMYKTDFDFLFVKGLGRVGAAISPSNSEETFFGPPGLEDPDVYLKRKQDAEKYKTSKITLATAINAYSNKRTDMRRLDVNVGVMLKYDRDTSTANLGGGLNGVIGPFTFGYSIYGDQTRVDDPAYGAPASPSGNPAGYPIVKYGVETYSAGIFLESFIFDYSVLHLVTTEVSTVTVLTASLLVGKAIITASKRSEESDRVAYDFETKSLKNEKTKNDVFAGVQYRVSDAVMVGAFYNYYLLHEGSIGATWFF
jgi:hypothetical protein